MTSQSNKLSIVFFTLAWIPIGIGLFERARVLLNTSWWPRIAGITPTIWWLRAYWFITIPLTAIALGVAAFLLLRRRPAAALVASVAFVIIFAICATELALLILIQHEFATRIGADMDIPPRVVGGFEGGIRATLTDLAYRGACLSYLLFSKHVRETFGSIDWKRLHVRF